MHNTQAHIPQRNSYGILGAREAEIKTQFSIG